MYGGSCTLKYFSRLKLYKGSNVEFSPETMIATSYWHWAFVKVISKKIVFNNYNFSRTASTHQAAVKALLRELGIKIDLVVQVKEGLNNIETLKELKAREKSTLEYLIAKDESKKQERKERAKISRLKDKVKKQLNDLGILNAQLFVGSGYALDYTGPESIKENMHVIVAHKLSGKTLMVGL